jgi:hypothetical protein
VMHGWQSESADETKGELCFLEWLH